MIDRKAIDTLVDWMVDGARPSASAKDIVDAICRTLVAAGIPIDRFALFIYTLDPNIVGRRFVWTPAQGVMVSEGKMGLFSTIDYTANPLPTVVEKRVSIRRRLHDPESPRDYRIVDELIADGFTDYLAQPLVYTTGETNAASWSTKTPGGFSDEAADVLARVNKPLARLTETYLLRLNAATILSAYVGRNSGDRILGGKIHRGDGEEIEAAILFTDLVDFTALSNTLDGPDIVAMLNDVFDVMVPPVASHGGEILKFLGDGFFAIFPYEGADALAQSVVATSQAVTEAETALASSALGPKMSFRSAIHAGRFHYGNIGGANRLDFTAIGRPVNYAARLLQAAASLACPRLLSDTVAGCLGDAARPMGEIEFKGFEGKQAVYTY
jgi:adenylate cyclase